MNDLTVYDTVNETTVYLTDGDYTVNSFCFSPDNTHIIASMTVAGGDSTACLYKISIDGSIPEKYSSTEGVTEHDDLHYSQDGEMIVYTETTATQQRIVYVNVNTGEKQYKTFSGNVYTSRLSPDGSRVCCVLRTGGENAGYKLHMAEIPDPPTQANSTEPKEIAVNGNFPNPFNPKTTIKFSLSSGGAVNLDIYNIAGQKVRDLLMDSLPSGNHNIIWDGCNNDGRKVSSGVYITRLAMGNHVVTQKMTMMK